jgi:AmmeMemoRadiSam system protein A
MFNEEQKKEMLALARSAIREKMEKDKILKKNPDELGQYLKEKGCVFVTLTLNGNLRGCIGHLTATKSLYMDIIENALGAAFDDPRFMPLQSYELEKIKIEISVLSAPRKIDYKDAGDLLKKLTPLKDGVILSKGLNKATYLPQVWESLSGKEAFLASLCMKAGLDPDAWRSGKLTVETYTVEKMEE